LIYPHCLRIADTLPWETSQVDKIITYQPKLQIAVAQSKTTSSLSAQPVRVQVHLLQQVFKMSFFLIHTVFEVSSSSRQQHRPQCSATSYAMIKCCLRSVTSLTIVSDIHDFASRIHAPYSAVNRTKIRTILKPDVGRKEFGVSR